MPIFIGCLFCVGAYDPDFMVCAFVTYASKLHCRLHSQALPQNYATENMGGKPGNEVNICDWFFCRS